MKEKIRNFCIIAHIDHGKSTLADRLLEFTNTVPKEKMKPQYLDQMELERERGITIKMAPCRMIYKNHILNLIDTPGHADFSYEVERSLAAVEGAILLVDGTKGIQAQTLAYGTKAKKQNLVLIPVINKIDLPQANINLVKKQLMEIFGFKEEEIILISAKEGTNIDKVIISLIEKIPPPSGNENAPLRALIFDSFYDPFKGVIASVKIVDGSLKKQEWVRFLATKKETQISELGYFSPQLSPSELLNCGEIGYLVTKLKEIKYVRIGDTVGKRGEKIEPLAGYREIKPMIFAGIYPTEGEDFTNLQIALEKLKLNDASLSFEKETSTLGQGFKCGFLGMLHLEITKERLEREFNLDILITTPKVAYQIKDKEIKEPWIKLKIVIPSEFLGKVFELLPEFRAKHLETKYFQNQVILEWEMPLASLILNFYDRLKSVTSGFGSFDWEFKEMRKGDLVKLDILVAGNKIEALSQIVPKDRAYKIGKELVLKLKELIPRELFPIPLQAAIGSKIIARETIPALKKNVTAHLYGGDITRKRKLWEKQKAGKKKLAKFGKVEVPKEVIMKIFKTI